MMAKMVSDSAITLLVVVVTVAAALKIEDAQRVDNVGEGHRRERSTGKGAVTVGMVGMPPTLIWHT
jgi:hypothetical protein